MKIITKADTYLVSEIEDILKNGIWDEDPRPKYSDGEPAHTKFVTQQFRQYDLSKGEFPICTLRKIAWKTGIKEIFTIYQKPTNKISEMEEMGVNWWNPWDIGDGTIGQRYGATVARYDLINNLIKDIQEDPYGRRKIMSLWQENDLRETEGLAPCAFLTMWTVRGDFLDMTLVQRSGDLLAASGAGCANETEYAALLMMIARHTGYKPGVFCHLIQNEHLYDRHFEQAEELVRRYRKRSDEKFEMCYLSKDIKKELEYWKEIKEKSTPRLILNPEKTNFYDFTIEDFTLENYEPDTPNLKLDLGI